MSDMTRVSLLKEELDVLLKALDSYISFGHWLDEEAEVIRCLTILLTNERGQL